MSDPPAFSVMPVLIYQTLGSLASFVFLGFPKSFEKNFAVFYREKASLVKPSMTLPLLVCGTLSDEFECNLVATNH